MTKGFAPFKKHLLFFHSFIFIFLMIHNMAYAQPTPITPSEAKVRTIAAYIYGYPLIAMDIQKQIMTNTVSVTKQEAPVGQFVHIREFITPAIHTVTAPNADMLYSFAWLNVTKEPYVLHVPNTHGRYYVLSLLDGWTDVFASLGSRTTGSNEKQYVIVGPHWLGKIPGHLTILRSPTNLIWIVGRTYSSGTPEDYKLVHAIQDEYRLVPLSKYQQIYTPAPGVFDPNIKMTATVHKQVRSLDGLTFFKRLLLLMKENPPELPQDQPMIDNFARLGLFPGKELDVNHLNPLVLDAMKKIPDVAQQKINDHFQYAGTIKNGWHFMMEVGQYKRDYLQRALIAQIALGAALPEDIVYPVTMVDSSGERLSGERVYWLHFTARELPPVNALWSLTMYNEHSLFVGNPINRYNVKPYEPLRYNYDGSLDIYIEHNKPIESRMRNWLPAPQGDFILILRLYWPKESVLKNKWAPPGLKQIRRI